MLKKVSDRDIALVPDEPVARIDPSSPGAEAPQPQGEPVLPAAEPQQQPPPDAGDAQSSRMSRFVFGGAKAIFQLILMGAILIPAFMVMNRMIASKDPPRTRSPFQTVYTIETVTAAAADHQPVFTAYGQTVAARNVELRALVGGEVVEISPNLQAGSYVSKGEPLVRIDDFNYKGAVEDAEASLAEARARIDENVALIAAEKSNQESMQEQLDLAVVDLQRAESLRRRGSGTQQNLEARKLVVSQRQQAMVQSQNTVKVQEARLAQQRAAIGRLEWALRQAQRNLESTVLKAPFDGIVRSASVEVGRLLSVNDVAVSIYEQNTLETKFTLTDAQYGRLQATGEGLMGREVEVVWTVGGQSYSYPAVIERLGAEITSNRGGVELFARLQSTQSAVTIRPGAFVEVRVPDVKFENTFAIPDNALFEGNIVYTNVDGVLVRNEVEIAAFDEDRVIVSSGLKEGDKVLNTRITEVSAGLRVREEGAPETPRGGNGAAAGRPSPEEIAKIAEANGMSLEALQALETGERRKLVRAYREAQAAKAE